MARAKTIRERAEEITRKYKKVNAHKFLFNKKGDLKARYKRIKAWFLIHDEQRGYSIMAMEFKRKALMSVEEWTALFKTGSGPYQSLYSIFTQAVLPAINNKGGNKWTFTSLLAWAGLRDLRQSKNPDASRTRNKPAKKRNANAHHSNRR
jgi:hypothetical protein